MAAFDKVMRFKEFFVALTALVVLYASILFIAGEYVEHKQVDLFNEWKSSGSQDIGVLKAMSEQYFSSQEFKDNIRYVSFYSVAFVCFLLGFWLAYENKMFSAAAYLYVAIVIYLLDFDIAFSLTAIICFYFMHMAKMMIKRA